MVLDSDPKVQIISEYERLQRNIRNEQITHNFFHVSSPRNFSSLAQHFPYRLKTLSSSEFLNDLGWRPLKINYFSPVSFVFSILTQYTGCPIDLQLANDANNRLGENFSPPIHNFARRKVIHFFERIDIDEGEKAEAVRLACIILEKMEVE